MDRQGGFVAVITCCNVYCGKEKKKKKEENNTFVTRTSATMDISSFI